MLAPPQFQICFPKMQQEKHPRGLVYEPCGAAEQPSGITSSVYFCCPPRPFIYIQIMKHAYYYLWYHMIISLMYAWQFTHSFFSGFEEFYYEVAGMKVSSFSSFSQSVVLFFRTLTGKLCFHLSHGKYHHVLGDGHKMTQSHLWFPEDKFQSLYWSPNFSRFLAPTSAVYSLTERLTWLCSYCVVINDTEEG